MDNVILVIGTDTAGGRLGEALLRLRPIRGDDEILRQSLVIARAIGMDRVLVTCDDDNLGSIAVIEACGGQLDSVIAAQASRIRRYWID